LSFQQQLEAKIFESQDAMAEAFGLSKAQVSKLLKAAQLLKQTTIAQLFADKSAVPVEAAYQNSLDRSRHVEPMKREYHVGPSTRMSVTRKPPVFHAPRNNPPLPFVRDH